MLRKATQILQVMESANGRIYLSNETLVEWRGLHSEQGLASDSAVAAFLFERNIDFINIHIKKSNTWLSSSLGVSLSLAFDIDSSQHASAKPAAILEVCVNITSALCNS